MTVSAVITGYQVRAGRILAGLDQATLAKKAEITRQALIAMEGCGANPVTSRRKTVAAVLAALGTRGILMQPRGVGDASLLVTLAS